MLLTRLRCVQRRTGLSFYGVRDLLIEGLTVEETGGKRRAIIAGVWAAFSKDPKRQSLRAGDGLYVQDLYNVTVRDATFMRNYRQVRRSCVQTPSEACSDGRCAQGMSISSCTNCSFVNTIFSNTSGTWPKCGVDVSLAARSLCVFFERRSCWLPALRPGMTGWGHAVRVTTQGWATF